MTSAIGPEVHFPGIIIVVCMAQVQRLRLQRGKYRVRIVFGPEKNVSSVYYNTLGDELKIFS